MRSARTAGLAAAVLLSPLVAHAQAPTAARQELEQGYALRSQGRYVDALPHLLESYRLEPQVKTLINLADCEEHVGKLVDARAHWKQAEGSADANAEIRAEADRRVVDLDRRTPRIRLVAAAGSPTPMRVEEDGVLMPAGSIGHEVAVDPGRHVFVVSADSYATKSYEIIVQAQEQRDLAVAPGAKQITENAPRDHASPTRPLRVAGAITAGVGFAALGVGAVFGLDAIAEQSAAHCPNNVCGTTGNRGTLEAAVRAGNISTVLFVAGGVLATGGIAMWILAPKPGESKVSLAARPAFAGAAIEGSW